MKNNGKTKENKENTEGEIWNFEIEWDLTEIEWPVIDIVWSADDYSWDTKINSEDNVRERIMRES